MIEYLYEHLGFIIGVGMGVILGSGILWLVYRAPEIQRKDKRIKNREACDSYPANDAIIDELKRLRDNIKEV